MAHRRTEGNVIYCPYVFTSNEILIQMYRQRMEELGSIEQVPHPDDELNLTLDWLEAEIESRYDKKKMSGMDVHRAFNKPISSKSKKVPSKQKITVDEGPSAA